MNSTHVVAEKLGDPGKVIYGYRTQMRLSKGEDWPARCDGRGTDFGEWIDSQPYKVNDQTEQMTHNAWAASRVHHTATMRRVGWLDQKGRVWTEMPSTADFDGGSLTPLLIDARED
jgi:hypothetical protein